jgi:hypothetical protein
MTASSRSSSTWRAERRPVARRYRRTPTHPGSHRSARPEALAILLDERAHLGRCGSSSPAKNTLVAFRISFTRRSSNTSRRSFLILRERSPLATSYAKHLFGQRIAVAPQTVAEARNGALSAGWGATRVEHLSRLIARARVLPVHIDTIEAVAQLRNECRQIGARPAPARPQRRPVDRGHRDPQAHPARRPRRDLRRLPRP